MASANQIVEMLRSHFEGDEERFRTAALQLAANEARMGHEGLAVAGGPIVGVGYQDQAGIVAQQLR